MLFILFDIEVVFLYPWAVVYKDMLADHATRNLIFTSMISFLVILFAGYLYALKKQASLGLEEVRSAPAACAAHPTQRKTKAKFDLPARCQQHVGGHTSQSLVKGTAKTAGPRHPAI